MAAAGRRDVGKDLAAEAGHELGGDLGLAVHLKDDTFMAVLDRTIVNVGSQGGIVDRDHGRLARRQQQYKEELYFEAGLLVPGIKQDR